MLYNICDPGLTMLREAIEDDQSEAKAKRFETVAARLFHLLGFNVDPLVGDSRLSEFVDAIAIDDPGEMCLAIECSIGPINSKGKLGKVIARAHEIGEAMESLRVLPVMATRLRRSAIGASDIEAASKDGVVVLAREDLQQLVQMAESGISNAETVAFLVERIPRRNGPLLSGPG